MKIIMRVQGGVKVGLGQHTIVLVPDLPSGADELRKYKDGQTVVADVRGARNPKQHNLFWKLMELVAENHPEINHKDVAYKECKIALDMYEWYIDRGGGAIRTFKSIAFDAMDQNEFSTFFQRAINWASDELGATAPEVIDALNELIGDKRYNDVLDRFRKGGR